jgi:HAD superfamily hydrolase (TIGR01509 family)
MTRRAVLWDLDGTLVDSEDYHWRSWQHALSLDGVRVTYDDFKATFGQRNEGILRGWLGRDASLDRINRIADAKEVEYRRLAAAHGLLPLPGAAEWLVRLRAGGWKQAVASSAPRLNVDVMLGALGLVAYFDVIVASEDVTRGKPEPDVFLTAAARLGVSPQRCVVVEDAPAGIEAARRAGMPSVGVSRTTTLPADVFVCSLDELADDAFDGLMPPLAPSTP